MSLSSTSFTPVFTGHPIPHPPVLRHTVPVPPATFPDHHDRVRFPGGHPPPPYNCKVDLSGLLGNVQFPSGCTEVHVVGAGAGVGVGAASWEHAKEDKNLKGVDVTVTFTETVEVFVTPTPTPTPPSVSVSTVRVTSIITERVDVQRGMIVTEKKKEVQGGTEREKVASVTTHFPGVWSDVGRGKGKGVGPGHGYHHGLEGRQLDRVLEGLIGGKSTLVRSVLTADLTVEWPAQETYDLEYHQPHPNPVAHPHLSAGGVHPVRVEQKQETEQDGFEAKWIGKGKGNFGKGKSGKGKGFGSGFGGTPEQKKSVHTGVLRVWPSRPSGGVRGNAKGSRGGLGTNILSESLREIGVQNGNGNTGNNGNTGSNRSNNNNGNNGGNTGNNNNNGNTNTNTQTGTTINTATTGTTTCSTTNPLLDISVDLLGLPIDVELYLDIANGNSNNNNNGGGLLSSVGSLVGNLLGGILGSSSSASSQSTIITDQFDSRCGQGLTGIANNGDPSSSSGTRTTGQTTAVDARQCLQLCQRAGILLTVQLGELNDCLGVTLRNGIAADNCLYLLGSASDILNLNVEIGDVGSDVFLNLARTAA